MPTFSTLALIGAAALGLGCLPTIALAQGTEEQQQACTPDALKLCSDTIPDIGKTTACMKAHYAQLTPRCQSAFHEATGGGKAAPARKAAEAAPHGRVTARTDLQAERRSSEHHASSRRLPDRNAMRDDRADVPASGEAAAVGAPRAAEGFPPFPSPTAPLAASTSPRSQIANACRAGIIDSFTCSTTVPALLGTTGE